MPKLTIKNIRPGSTVGVFNNLDRLIRIYVDIVFWDQIDVEVDAGIEVLIRVRTSRLRVLPSMPFETIIPTDSEDIVINAVSVADAIIINKSSTPTKDRRITGALYEWARTTYPEVKIDSITSHIIMIKSVGTICCSEDKVQIINKNGRVNLILADPDLFDKVEKHLGKKYASRTGPLTLHDSIHWF